MLSSSQSVSFLALVERVVAVRLHHYLNSNNLLPSCQSAYRKYHSTETAMLHVWSDITTAVDQRQLTLLALLDMSSAFDCVSASTAAAGHRDKWYVDGMDQFLPVWSDVPASVWRWTLDHSSVAVRCTTRVTVGPTAVCPLHSWHLSCSGTA